MTETRLVHEGQRRATTLLAAVAPAARVPTPAVAELRDFIVASLDHHHRSEDDDLWPLLVGAAPGLTDALDRLSREHERLDAALHDLAAVPLDGACADRRAVATAAATVRDLVHDHLGHEEPVLFPALAAHLDDSAWSRFSQRTVAGAPQAGKHLLVGFLDQVGSPEDVDVILRHLPPPARDALPAVRAQASDALTTLTGEGAGRP